MKPSMRAARNLIGQIALTLVSLIVWQSAYPSPMKWTIECLDSCGWPDAPVTSGSFIYDQDTREISDLYFRTGPGPAEQSQDFFGVLTQGGAIYTRVARASIGELGQLEGMVLEGAPVNAPELLSYWFISAEGFDTPLIDVENCQFDTLYLCRLDPLTGLFTSISTGFHGEFACALGTSGVQCGQGDLSNLPSYRLVAFSGDVRLVGAPVPLPAAAWLFASALAGLAWLRRSLVRRGPIPHRVRV